MVGHRAGSRPGGAGQGVPDAARTPGPCVFRPDPVFFDRNPVFFGRNLCPWPCVFRAGACVSGGKQVSSGRCHRPGACVNGHVSTGGAGVLGMCHGAGACVNGPKHVSLGCRCSIPSTLRDAGPLPVRAPPGPGGASRDAVGASGPCVFRPDPVFFDRTLCFSGGSMCLWREAGVLGQVSSAGSMCQRACVNGRGRCPRHVSWRGSMCQRAAACVFGLQVLDFIASTGCGAIAGSRSGGAGRGVPGRCRRVRALCFSTGPCVFRPGPVFFDRTLCFSGGACVFGPVFFGAEAGVSGGKQVSLAGSRCHRADQVPSGMCHRAGACVNGQVPMRRGMCQRACVIGRCRRVGAGPAQRAAARAGAAKRRPSSRSSRPPWPGISRPLSFLPEARFQ